MSKLRQLQSEGRLPESSMAARDRDRQSTLRQQSTIRTPPRGRRERLYLKKEHADVDLDPEILVAVRHFLTRSKDAGTIQTGSEYAIHKLFTDRVDISQLRRLTNHHTGKSMWPEVLVTLVDMYWDEVANPRNEWAWKHFVSSKVFDRLLAYLLSRIEDEYARQADTRTPEQRRAEREANWARIAERRKSYTPVRPAPRRVTKTAVEGPSDEDVWGDDLEEWEALMAKKRAARKRQQEEGE